MKETEKYIWLKSVRENLSLETFRFVAAQGGCWLSVSVCLVLCRNGLGINLPNKIIFDDNVSEVYKFSETL